MEAEADSWIESWVVWIRALVKYQEQSEQFAIGYSEM